MEDLIRREDALAILDLSEHDAEERDWRSGANEIARLIQRVRSIPASPDVAEAEARGTADADLLLDAYKGLLVLHRMCEKSGLTAGAVAAENITNRIVAAHPEVVGLASLRAEAALLQARADAASLRAETDAFRMCVNCGLVVSAAHDRAQPGPGCQAPNACTFDMTPREAWEYWRGKAHQARADAAAAQATLEKRNAEIVAERDVSAELSAKLHAIGFIDEPTEPGSFIGDIWFGHSIKRTLGTHRWTGAEWAALPSEMDAVLDLLAAARAEIATLKGASNG